MQQAMEFVHIGVPTKTPQPGESYVEGMKVHLTDPDAHEYKYEYLRFEPGSWLPPEVQLLTHVAIKVPNMEEARKKCQELLTDVIEVNENLSICFAKRDGVLFELMEHK